MLGRHSSVQERETPSWTSACELPVTSAWFQSPQFPKVRCSSKNTPKVSIYVENRVALQICHHSYWELTVQPMLQFSWEEWLIPAQARVLWTGDFQPPWPGLAPCTTRWQSISSLKFWHHGWSHIQDDKSPPCGVELLHSEAFLLAPVKEPALICPKILVKAKASFFWRILLWWSWMKA